MLDLASMEPLKSFPRTQLFFSFLPGLSFTFLVLHLLHKVTVKMMGIFAAVFIGVVAVSACVRFSVLLKHVEFNSTYLSTTAVFTPIKVRDRKKSVPGQIRTERSVDESDSVESQR